MIEIFGQSTLINDNHSVQNEATSPLHVGLGCSPVRPWLQPFPDRPKHPSEQAEMRSKARSRTKSWFFAVNATVSSHNFASNTAPSSCSRCQRLVSNDPHSYLGFHLVFG